MQAHALYTNKYYNEAYVLQCTKTLTVVTLAKIISRFNGIANSGSGISRELETENETKIANQLYPDRKLFLVVAARFIPAGE